jgi:hypothetical protein
MTDRTDVPPIHEGTVLRLEEPEYRYGVGRLTLRVVEMPDDDDTRPDCVCLSGVRIDWRGVEVGPCRIYVSVDAVRRQIQRRVVAD